MRNSIRSIVAILGVIFLASPVSAAQTCRTDFPVSTPTSRYIFNENGTVTDKETEITWMRCALGQTWNGKECAGDAQDFSWQEAVDAVADVNKNKFGGYSAWRLPFVPELASIVERQCFDPRVNLEVFPGTPSRAFWTGMERKGHPDQAYKIDFGKGAATPSDKTYRGPVRMMQDGPNGRWWNPPKMPPG